MQNSSWAIFREQVGILVEVYNRRHEFHSQKQVQQQQQIQVQKESNNALSNTTIAAAAEAVSFVLPRFTIDTIHPIRC